MDFELLSWGALCFYYRSARDRKYTRIMTDAPFLHRIRTEPQAVDPAEFEGKVILDYVHIDNYDLLVGHRLAEEALSRIVSLQATISPLLEANIHDCDLADRDTAMGINTLFAELSSVRGLWLTGVSKIMHVLNDRLFAMITPDIVNAFGLVDDEKMFLEWLKRVQQNAAEVLTDFRQYRLPGSPEALLSEKLGYASAGYQKSMVKFLDEYIWLRYVDDLPIPPPWLPPFAPDTETIATDPFRVYAKGDTSGKGTIEGL